MRSSTPDAHRFDFCPWLYYEEAAEAERAAQSQWQAQMAENGRAVFGQNCFVSPLAAVFPARLEMGDRSYIAAYAYVTDEVTLGADCTVNPYAVVRGKVTAGDGVRIGAHSSLLGFNHRHDDPHTPIFQQEMTSKGIAIGDDVWIGSAAVVVDGVTIGSHSIVAAGAVATRDVPDYCVVGGNPARVLRRRLNNVPSAAASESLGAQLETFGKRARQQWPEVLSYYVGAGDDGPCYLNQPAVKPSVRAWCDAVEIAALFDGVPELSNRDDLIARLRSFQDPATGLFPDPWRPPAPARDEPARMTDDLSRYNVLAVGYALELLGTQPLHPIGVVESMSVPELYRNLENLPWSSSAWDCGDWIDSYATGLYFNLRYFNSKNTPAPLFGWLLIHVDHFSGMWGGPRREDGWLQPVNGFYRLARGTYAQFGVSLSYPQAAIDTVLAHSCDTDFFRVDRGNACNVLDVTHGLWLCGLQTGYRRAEAQDWARRQVERALTQWVDGQGFSFALELGGGAERAPSLQGAEMWLSIIFLLAELIGESEALGYRPQGVHRLEPAWPL